MKSKLLLAAGLVALLATTGMTAPAFADAICGCKIKDKRDHGHAYHSPAGIFHSVSTKYEVLGEACNKQCGNTCTVIEFTTIYDSEGVVQEESKWEYVYDCGTGRMDSHRWSLISPITPL